MTVQISAQFIQNFISYTGLILKLWDVETGLNFEKLLKIISLLNAFLARFCTKLNDFLAWRASCHFKS